MKCSSCEHVFRIFKGTESREAYAYLSESDASAAAGETPPSDSQPPDPAEAIVVRSEDGVISQIPDEATLQRMIVQRKLSPTDELSYDSETWEPLGSIESLQPFFALLLQVSPSQASQTSSPEPGPVLIAGQADASSTLEFGLPAGYPSPMVPPSHARGFGHDSSQGVALHPHQGTDKYASAYSHDSSPSQPSADLPFSPPVYTSSQNALLPATSTATYGSSFVPQPHVSSSSAENLATGVSYATLEPQESSEHHVRVERANNQGRIPTVVTRSSDEWPLGPAVRLPSHDEMGASATPTPLSAPSSSETQPQAYSSETQPRAYSAETQPRAYSSPSMERTQISQDELFSGDNFRRSSRSGRWFALLVVLLGLSIGGYSLFNPGIFGKVAIYLGLSEALPSALETIEDVRHKVQTVTPKALQQAHNTLREVAQQTTKPFAALVATQATVDLLHTDVLRMRSYLLEKKIAYWIQQRADLSKADDTPSSTSDDQDTTKQDKQRQELTALLQRWWTQKKRWKTQLEEQKQRGFRRVKQAHKHNASHPYTQIAMLYQRSFVTASSKAKDPRVSKASRHSLRLLKTFREPRLKNWVYLSSASAAVWNGRYKQGIAQARQALHQRGRTTWLFPRFLIAMAWSQLAHNNKLSEPSRKQAQQNALRALQTIEAQAAQHPVVAEFREYLTPPSLSDLLESREKPPTDREVAPGEPVSAAVSDAGTPPQVAPRTAPTAPRMLARAHPQPRRTQPRPAPSQRRPSPPRATARRSSPPRAAARRSSPPRGWRNALQRAYRDCERGDKNRGLRNAQQLVQRKKNGYSYATLGWCYFHKRQYNKAIQTFRQALRAGNARNDTYYGLGLAQASQNQRSQACKSFRQQLRRYPKYRDNFEVRIMLRKHKCK